jgi:hypothetical protein
VGFLAFGQSLVLIDRVMGRARRYSGDGEEAVASTHQEAEARTTAAA